MPKFEVFIPAADEDSLNVTFRVDAATWMAALKAGMQKLGEQGPTTKNVLVDIHDDRTVHVTEPVSGRVFQLREMTDADDAAAQPKRRKTDLPGAARPVPPEDQRVGGSRADDPIERIVVPKAPASANSEIEELERPTRPITGRIGRVRSTTAERAALEDTLAEVFERVADLMRECDTQKAMYLLLDLALEKIPAESGSVLRADMTSGQLSFLAARGPNAVELLETKVVTPDVEGVVGFSSMEGMSVALSRRSAALRDTSVLTAPMTTHGRAFGCFQILNRRDGEPFGAPDVGILSYLAQQGALYLNDRA